MTIAQLGESITPPLTSPDYQNVDTGLPKFISNLINLAAIIGGIFVLLNFIIAGYAFMTAAGDPKKVQNAWAKIWQSLLGLVIIVSAIAVISVIQDIFGIKILEPVLTGPGNL